MSDAFRARSTGQRAQVRAYSRWKSLDQWPPFITGPASTLMGCENDQKSDQFVPVRGEGFLRRYNHKLPVVVYVQEGFEVRYRIWSADESLQEARPE